MSIDFSKFEDMQFPTYRDIVYILYYLRESDSTSIPFYVGETSRHVGRFGDYLSAKFSAPTDFKVGEAVKYLRSRGFSVVIKYKESINRKSEEKSILDQLGKEHRLLNHCPGYDYRKSKEDNEKVKIHDFMDEIIADPRPLKRNDTASDQNTIFEKNRNSVNVSSKGDNHKIPEKIKAICEVLGEGGKEITRKDILLCAKLEGINESSVLPADYCENTPTGKWSKHKFLHSVRPGVYKLRRFVANTTQK